VFFEYIRNSQLRSLHLTKVDVSSQFATLLTCVKVARNLTELRLAEIPIQIEHRLDRLKAFMDADKLKSLQLWSNKMANIEFLTAVAENKIIAELELID